MVREIREDELQELLQLYLHLHEVTVPEMDEHLEKTWNTILHDEAHHIIVNEVDGKIVATVVCLIVPNLTHNVRPYAIVENVVTHEDYRGRGLAGECLEYAKELAIKENCYRLTLATGSKKEETLHFYEKNGYNREDKTAFNQWLD